MLIQIPCTEHNDNNLQNILTYNSGAEMDTQVLSGFLKGFEQLETLPNSQHTSFWANQPLQSGKKKSQIWCGNYLERRLSVLEYPLLRANKKSHSSCHALCAGFCVLCPKDPPCSFFLGIHHTKCAYVTWLEGKNLGVLRGLGDLARHPSPNSKGIVIKCPQNSKKRPENLTIKHLHY